MVCIAIGLSVIAANEHNALIAMTVPFLCMRVIQPFFNYLEERVGRASMTGNVIIFLFMLVINVSA